MSGYDRQRQEQLRLQYLRMRRMTMSQRERQYERERFLRRPYDSKGSGLDPHRSRPLEGVLDIHQRGLVGGNIFDSIWKGVESVAKVAGPFVPLLL